MNNLSARFIATWGKGKLVMSCERFKTLCKKAGSCTNMRELCHFVLDELTNLTSSQYALISFFDPEAERLVVEISKGFRLKLPPTRFGHGPMGVAMEKKESVFGKYEDFPHLIPELAQEIGHIVAVPMLFENRVVGAIGIGRTKGASPYSLEERDLIESFSCTVTPVFVHRRYLVRNRVRNRRISGINRLFARLIQLSKEEDLLDQALTHAVRLFGADGGSVILSVGGMPVMARRLGIKRPPTPEEFRKGLASEVMSTRKGIRLRNYLEHPKAVRAFCDDNDIGSIMLEPIFDNHGRLLGVFVIYRTKGKAVFTTEDGAEFRLFCHHVGLAIEQKRLTESLHQQIFTRETVFEAIQKVLTEAEIDPHQLVVTLLNRAVELLDADFAGYHVWVPSRGLLEPYYQTGFDFELPAMRLGEGVAGMAVAKKDVVIVTKYENEVHHQGAKRTYGSLVRSAISVPLIYRGEVLGAMSLGRGHRKPPLQEEDASTLRLFGAVASSILGYTRTFQEAQKKTERLNHIHRLEALGTLGVGIAHDFNNVLTGIVGYLEMAKDELDTAHPAYFGIDGAMRLVDRATSLARQILSVAGRGGGEETIFDPAPQLKELVKMAKSTFPKSIEVKLDLPKKTPTIYADPTQFHQVVLNLMVNAKEAMPHGGELRMVVREREITEEDMVTHPELIPGSYLVVSISDTGHGIPEDSINKIFEPGFTTKEEGTGWGLFTSFSIVKKMGGTITVYSQEGIGSTFRVYLPIAEGREARFAEVGTRKVSVERVGGRNLLVVDDERSLLENTKLLLEKLGYKVVTAEDGDQALKIYQQHWRKIDGVVLDMVMPGMNGLEVFMAMKQVNPDVKVLLVSGHARNGLIDKAIGMGAKGLLVKPYTSKELAETIEEVFFK